MAGSKNPGRKQGPPTSGSGAASRSSGSGADINVADTVSDSDPRKSQQQDVKGSNSADNAAEVLVSDHSHVPLSMQHSPVKGPVAQAIADDPAAVVARESQLMLLASEIAELKALHKAKKPNLLAVLEERQEELTGLPLHAVRLHTLRVNITAALNSSGGQTRVNVLECLCMQLLFLARGPSPGHDLRSSTAYALMAYCMFEIVKEVGQYRETGIAKLHEFVHEVKHFMGFDEASGSLHQASDWLDPKLETVIEGKGAAKVDKVEGQDLSARLMSRVAYMEGLLKQMIEAQQLEEQKRMRQEHMKQVRGTEGINQST